MRLPKLMLILFVSLGLASAVSGCHARSGGVSGPYVGSTGGGSIGG